MIESDITLDDIIEKLNETEIVTRDKDDIKIDLNHKYPSIKLHYLDCKNNFNPKKMFINGLFWNYIENLTQKLDKKMFFGYINKTISFYPIFKDGNMSDAKDFFRRCQVLAILQLIAFMNGSLSEIQGITKICSSKNGKKNSCLIDDSTILNEDNTLRISNGTLEEPHRGYEMFMKLSTDKKNSIINSFHIAFIQLENILKRIKNNQYMLFNPIDILQRIIRYCEHSNKTNIINTLSWEIHDKPYSLKKEELINIFHNYDNLMRLWDTDFITDNQGKFRIFIISIHFIDLIYRNQINEIYE